MSEKKTNKAPKAIEHKYPIEELLTNSYAITGHKPEVAAGALFGCKEKELTKEEFKERVDKFLKTEVEKPKKEVK